MGKRPGLANRPRVFKAAKDGSHPWAIERGRDRTIVSVWPDQASAFRAAERMASMSTGFGLAV